jgi:hypothetical protein
VSVDCIRLLVFGSINLLHQLDLRLDLPRLE